jgi:pimeloyl-ACP methyl ester carboxylesterase
MDERIIDVGGHKVLHREVGEGPPLLCLHGFPQTGHCWRGVADRLSSRFRVLMPDVPGFGASDAPARHDADTVAAILFDYLDSVGAPTSLVMGHDWGGAFAFRMALDRPARVDHLIIVNSPFRELSPRHSWYIGVMNLPLIPELAFRFAGDRIIGSALTGWSSDKGRGVFEGEPLLTYQEAYRDPERVRSALGFYRTVSRQAFSKQVKLRVGRLIHTTAIEGGSGRRIETPTLVVWGMQDHALPPSLLPGIKRDIPQAEVVELAECGHFVPEECPDGLAEAIDTFVP